MHLDRITRPELVGAVKVSGTGSDWFAGVRKLVVSTDCSQVVSTDSSQVVSTDCSQEKHCINYHKKTFSLRWITTSLMCRYIYEQNENSMGLS